MSAHPQTTCCNTPACHTSGRHFHPSVVPVCFSEGGNRSWSQAYAMQTSGTTLRCSVTPAAFNQHVERLSLFFASGVNISHAVGDAKPACMGFCGVCSGGFRIKCRPGQSCMAGQGLDHHRLERRSGFGRQDDLGVRAWKRSGRTTDSFARNRSQRGAFLKFTGHVPNNLRPHPRHKHIVKACVNFLDASSSSRLRANTLHIQSHAEISVIGTWPPASSNGSAACAVEGVEAPVTATRVSDSELRCPPPPRTTGRLCVCVHMLRASWGIA